MSMLGYIGRQVLRVIVPAPIRFRLSRLRANNSRYSTGSISDIFAAIYRDGLWGSGDEFYSGLGSHAAFVTEPYLKAVRHFLRSLGDPIDVVDLGCGDFAVGSQLRHSCNKYIACDIVPELIVRNRKKFAGLDVDFVITNLIEDNLPDGKLALIRQVLQHLSNEQIFRILIKLQRYEYLIVTEHLPAGTFIANLDKSAGPTVRTEIGSGIDLAEEPFNVHANYKTVLCEVYDATGCVRTTLYNNIRLGRKLALLHNTSGA